MFFAGNISTWHPAPSKPSEAHQEKNMFTKSIAAQRPFKLALIASIALVTAAVSAPGLAANSISADSTANVMVPIAITKSSDLVFGKFAAKAGGGSVTVATNGARTGTGVYLAAGTTTAASFAVKGEPNATYSIDLSSVALSNGTPAQDMTLSLISALTASAATSGSVTSGTLDGSGDQVLYVGGALTVADAQAGGLYSGTVTAAVDYN
jgi:hypothetical protein